VSNFIGPAEAPLPVVHRRGASIRLRPDVRAGARDDPNPMTTRRKPVVQTGRPPSTNVGRKSDGFRDTDRQVPSTIAKQGLPDSTAKTRRRTRGRSPRYACLTPSGSHPERDKLAGAPPRVYEAPLGVAASWQADA
jgi:hypothetical protein